VVQLKHPITIPSYQTVYARQGLFDPGINIQYGKSGQLLLGQQFKKRHIWTT